MNKQTPKKSPKEMTIDLFVQQAVKDYTLLTEINILNRNIYFNLEVCDFEIDKLLRYMEMLQLIDNKKDINLYINSGGGDVTSCLKFYDGIRERISVKVNTIVEGISMSAATVMSVGATGKRYITPHSSMMFHEISTFSIGKISDEKQKLNWIENLQNKIKQIYISHSNIKDIKKWEKIMARDSFFTAEESLENGFVDEIIKNNILKVKK